jgi:DNA-binding NarL/FixJ family response regulator
VTDGAVRLPEGLADPAWLPRVPTASIGVVEAPAIRPRVLLGELEPMVRVGMTRVLVEGGAEVLPDVGPDDGVIDRARSDRPDVVVLAEWARSLGDAVRRAAPEAKLIVFSRDESEMTVYDPGSAVPRRVGSAAPEALVDELTGSAP